MTVRRPLPAPGLPVPRRAMSLPRRKFLTYNCSLVVPSKELAVKAGIHPNYEEVVARCACGNTFTTRSTKSELHLDICNACHPFFTGRQKLIDTEGRVDRFTKRFGAQSAAAVKEAAKANKAAKAAKSARRSSASA
jgi:ribosomal protein L31